MKNRLGHPGLEDRNSSSGAVTGDLPRAIIAGTAAALLGGLAWIAVAFVAQAKVSALAWGVGALVGFAMARANPTRSPRMGLLAVLLATVGLVLGTTVIAVKLMPATPAPAPIPLSARIQADSEFMAQVTAWDLKQRKTFLPASEAARGIEA